MQFYGFFFRLSSIPPSEFGHRKPSAASSPVFARRTSVLNIYTSARTFWHTLFKVNGAPGAVGRVLVTVRNLGAGNITRPARGHSIPGGYPEWRGTGEIKSRWGRGVSQGSGDRVSSAAEKGLPDNPLLLEFFPRNSKIHDALFFRFGGMDEDVLPFNERVRVSWALPDYAGEWIFVSRGL